MRTILTGSIIALGMMAVTPVLAQAVYVGPGGVGVDTGVRPYGYGYDRDHNREWRHRHYRDGVYEGRSAYPDRYYRDR